MSREELTLKGKVCLVTGATRGVGKGVALMLAKAGAIVYITGRTEKSVGKQRGSLADTVAETKSFSGQCIPVQCDHAKDDQVEKVFEKINNEQNGRLDILVNNAYAGVIGMLREKHKMFYEEPISQWDQINDVGLRSNYVAAHFAANMMIPNKQGLIITVSSPAGLGYFLNVPDGIGKAANDRMMADMAIELKIHNIATISLWPGAVLTETVDDFLAGRYGEEATARVSKLFFQASVEDPTFTGKAVVALGSDKNIMKKSGRILVVAELAREYGFKDVGDKQPFSFRQVKYVVRRSYPALEWIVPEFLYVPWWIISIATHKF